MEHNENKMGTDPTDDPEEDANNNGVDDLVREESASESPGIIKGEENPKQSREISFHIESELEGDTQATDACICRCNSLLNFWKKETQEQDQQQRDLQHRLRHATNPDTKVLIGETEFPCHLVLLQAYSKYFDGIRRPAESVFRLSLPEDIIPAKHFPTLMNWILLEESCKHRVVTKENVVSLYAAGHFLGIQGLTEHCWEFILEKIQQSDPIVVQLYDQARELKPFKELRKVLSSKLAQMFNVLYESRQFLSLGVNDFVVILDSDDVNVQSELDLFHAASRWLLFDWEGRNKYAVRLMKCVRFGLLSSLQLTQIRHCVELEAEKKDYTQIFSFPEIQDLIKDGLTYAIFRENYESDPEELKKWLDWSQVKHPRRRNYSQGQTSEIVQEPLKETDQKAGDESIGALQIPGKEEAGLPLPGPSRLLRLDSQWTRKSSGALMGDDDGSRVYLSKRKPSRLPLGSRKSSIHDPFTLASVLRKRMEE